MTVSIGLGRVESVSWWVGLGQVTQNGPMDNSAVNQWTRRVIGSTCCRSLISGQQLVRCKHCHMGTKVLAPWAGYFQRVDLNTFSNKIYGSNFNKQHSETLTVWNYQDADCSLKNNFIVLFIIIFDTMSFPVRNHVHRIFQNAKFSSV